MLLHLSKRGGAICSCLSSVRAVCAVAFMPPRSKLQGHIPSETLFNRVGNLDCGLRCWDLGWVHSLKIYFFEVLLFLVLNIQFSGFFVSII